MNNTRVFLTFILLTLLLTSCSRIAPITHNAHATLPDCTQYCNIISNLDDKLYVFPLRFDKFTLFCASMKNELTPGSGSEKRWTIAFEYHGQENMPHRLMLHISNALEMKKQPFRDWKGSLRKDVNVMHTYSAKYEKLLATDGNDYCSLTWRVGDVSMLLDLDPCDIEPDEMIALTNYLVPVSQAKQMCRITPTPQ